MSFFGKSILVFWEPKGFPMLAPKGGLAMMVHSRDFLLMSKFSGNVMSCLENTFIHSFIHSKSFDGTKCI